MTLHGTCCITQRKFVLPCASIPEPGHSSLNLCASRFQRPVSHTLFSSLRSCNLHEKITTVSILEHINFIPMVSNDLTYGLRHFWQRPQTICHCPRPITISNHNLQKVTSHMQNCGFYLAATWLFVLISQLQISNSKKDASLWFPLRCNPVLFMLICSNTIFKKLFSK